MSSARDGDLPAVSVGRGVLFFALRLSEQAKSMPFGAVWDEYCRREGCPTDGEVYPLVAAYEAKILPTRQ